MEEDGIVISQSTQYLSIFQNPGLLYQGKNLYCYAYIKADSIGNWSINMNSTLRSTNLTTQKEKISLQQLQETYPSIGLSRILNNNSGVKVYYLGCLDLDDIFGTNLPTKAEMDAITDITGPINEITTTTKEQLKLLLKFIREGN